MCFVKLINYQIGIQKIGQRKSNPLQRLLSTNNWNEVENMINMYCSWFWFEYRAMP